MPVLEPEVTRLVLGPLQTNCYLIRCPETSAALVVDPADSPSKILEAARSTGATITRIFVTHCHPDHIGALAALREASGARVSMHRLDAEQMHQQAGRYSLGPEELGRLLPDDAREGGEEFAIGHLSAAVILTPGHSPGGITLCCGNYLFVGDTLFAGSVGRVDIPGGDWDRLTESVQNLYRFADETIVCPGHGPTTTIGQERMFNPFVRG